ncbi:MAG TPA: baseplate J/gp47 family protein [Myxococcota bacterium]|jgi:hypothetical protein|nr:baseplate J/gp47 family protein [Myxococcota bacterium]
MNASGREAVDYRAGDYASFREALLRARPGETALAGWHPTATGDLALQLLEWWAYLADVLTFYNERAFQEVLLRTAVHPEDVRRIVRLLGYRPRPGIGAIGLVAARTRTPHPIVIPRGFGIEGASRPGEPEQIFEVDEDVDFAILGRGFRFGLPGFDPVPGWGSKMFPTPKDAEGFLLSVVEARIPVDPRLEVKEGESFTVTLDGVMMTLKPKDLLLLLKNDWNAAQDAAEDAGIAAGSFALAMVTEVKPIWDAHGHAVTHVTAIAAHSLADGALRKDHRILKPTKNAHLWLYHERYPGSTDPALLAVSAANQTAENIGTTLGAIFTGGASLLFTGGPNQQQLDDPRVIAGAPISGISKFLGGVAHLEAITRGILPGDPVLIENKMTGGIVEGLFQLVLHGAIPSAPLPQPVDVASAVTRDLYMQLVKVTGYAEDIWYGNAPQMDRIGRCPPVAPPGGHGVLSGQAEGPIPIPHSRIEFPPNPFIDLLSGFGQLIKDVVVHYGWQEVGEMVDSPPPAETTEVEVPPAPDVPPDVPVPVLVKDAAGVGVLGWLGQAGRTPFEMKLVPPLEAYVHLLPVSRGRTVAREILGRGDPILVWQEFVLKRSPLTYLPAADVAGTGYRSTLRVRVDGIEWHEVPSFYGQAPDARVFVTREDDQQKTHVRFGDGEHGARLPGGTDNVIATYRFGSGAAIPPAGTLTSALDPLPGLQSIVNPIPVGGGADPDPPDQLRRYAPRSVLTFGRAVSGDDYETVAAQTPAVKRARAYWGWDADSQRAVVKVFVGDDDPAVQAATDALRAFADPNRPVVVALAAPVYAELGFTIEVHPDHQPETVRAAVAAALLDPRSQTFGSEVVRIGQTVYDSQIYDACLRIPGVVAVRALRFAVAGAAEPGERHSPAEGRFYLLAGDRLDIKAEVARHG